MTIESALPRHEARRLLEAVDGDEERFRELEAERLAGRPLQYLEGTAPFGPLDLVVDERVLIPRPETEQLWVLARSLVSEPQVVVDLCAGSGALALACKWQWPDARVIAGELSPEAVAVAALNAERLDLDIEIYQGDLFDPFPDDLHGEIDLLVGNPPYVSAAEWEELPADVRCEPRMALVPGETGTEIIDRIGLEAPGWLAPGGWMVLEIGETQGDHVLSALEPTHLVAEVRKDLADRDRFVVAHRP